MLRKLVLLILSTACLGACVPEAQFVAPTETPTPRPAATATQTATATITTTPTLTPTASPVPCDFDTLIQASENLGDLTYYQIDTTMDLTDIATGEQFSLVLTLQQERADGQVTAVTFKMAGNLDPDENIEFILIEDQFYFRRGDAGEDGWNAIGGLLGESLLDRFSQEPFLNAGWIERLQAAPCKQIAIAGQQNPGTAFLFEDVVLEDAFVKESLTLGESLDEVGAVDVQVWVRESAGLLLPFKFEMDFEVSLEGWRTRMLTDQVFSDFNAASPIQAPTIEVAPVFFLDLPLPPDAEILTEGENILVLVTLTSPEEALAHFLTYFEDTGWILTDRYEATQDDIVFQVAEFTHEELGLDAALLVGETEGVTLVSISGGFEGGTD